MRVFAFGILDGDGPGVVTYHDEESAENAHESAESAGMLCTEVAELELHDSENANLHRRVRALEKALEDRILLERAEQAEFERLMSA